MTEIRELTSNEEFVDAVRLQKEIWGFEEVDLLPVRLFIVASKIGGQVLGAFDNSRMIGFCLSIPGVKPDGRSYLHSHMLGVRPEYRNSGLGRTLKLRQRQDALARGIGLIEWTFDPLELKNAHFNLERLGAIVRRYVLNQYGSTSSPLHGGLPTDRCVAEWWLAHPRVQAIVDGRTPDPAPVEATVSVPCDIARLKTENPKQARAIQEAMSNQFLDYFSKGLAVIGFGRSEDAGTYLLGPWA